jgi:hypothetical protein
MCKSASLVILIIRCPFTYIFIFATEYKKEIFPFQIFDLMGKPENDNTAQSEKIFDKVGDIFEVRNTKKNFHLFHLIRIRPTGQRLF